MQATERKLHVSNGYNIDLPQTARLLQWLANHQDSRWNLRLVGGELGLAEKMVKYVAALASAMGLMTLRKGRLTRFGAVMCQLDPYLSGDLTPWLLHYNLAANPEHIVWHKMVNTIIPLSRRFSSAEAKCGFEDISAAYATTSVGDHVSKELRAFLQAYTEGALSRLALLQEDDGVFVAPSALRVPPVAFGYALLSYATTIREGDSAIPIEDLVCAPSSPGRVFLMRDYDVQRHLERMHRDGVISIESRAHLDQIRVAADLDPAEYLAQHYGDVLEGEQ